MSNYLLRLGWGHGDEEIISREDAIRWFDLDHVGRSPSRFDLKKLESLNGHYLREADPARLAALVAPKIAGADEALLARAMPVLTVRAKDLNELAEGAAFLFASAPAGDGREGGGAARRRRAGPARPRPCGARQIADWSAEATEQAVREVAEAEGVKLGQVAQPLAGGAHRAGDIAGYFRCADAARAARKASPGWRTR